MKKLILVFALIFVGLFTADRAQAQMTISLGPQVGIDLSRDADNIFIGADAVLTSPMLPVEINPDFQYYLGTENYTAWNVNLNARYPFGINNQMFTPYVGAGVALYAVDTEFTDMDTNFGLNVVGGARFGFGALQPFAEARLTFIEGEDPAIIRGGILFTF